MAEKPILGSLLRHALNNPQTGDNATATPAPEVTTPRLRETPHCLRFGELPSLNLETLAQCDTGRQQHIRECALCQNRLQAEATRRAATPSVPSVAPPTPEVAPIVAPVATPRVRTGFPSLKRTAQGIEIAAYVQQEFFHPGTPAQPEPIRFDKDGTLILNLTAAQYPKLRDARRVRLSIGRGSKASFIPLCEVPVENGALSLRLPPDQMSDEAAALKLRSGYVTADDLQIEVIEP